MDVFNFFKYLDISFKRKNYHYKKKIRIFLSINDWRTRFPKLVPTTILIK